MENNWADSVWMLFDAKNLRKNDMAAFNWRQSSKLENCFMHWKFTEHEALKNQIIEISQLYSSCIPISILLHSNRGGDTIRLGTTPTTTKTSKSNWFYEQNNSSARVSRIY